MSGLPGIVVGLAAEARIARRLGYPVGIGGGTPEGARAAASRLLDSGAGGLISFGLAGGLDPALRPGDVLLPAMILTGEGRYLADPSLGALFGGLTGHRLWGGTRVAGTVSEKLRLFERTGSQAIDLESGVVARLALDRGVPFIAVRAVCDPADRDLPPAALAALDQAGAIGVGRVLQSVLRHPGQVPALVSLARDAAAARRALVEACRR